MRKKRCQCSSRRADSKALPSKPPPFRRYFVVLRGGPAEVVVEPWRKGYAERKRLAASAGLLLDPDAQRPFARFAATLAGGKLLD